MCKPTSLPQGDRGAQGKSAQGKTDSPRVSLFLCAPPCGEKVDEQKFRREQRDNLVHSGPLKPAVRAHSIRSGVDSYSYQKN
jgi:hypothetical protein